MSFKTIKVNPVFLSSDNSGFSVKNKTRKEKPAGISLGQSNNIKKKLIARIKNFQQNSKVPPAANPPPPVNMDVFSDSVQFLDNLARDKEEKKRDKKNTLKKKHAPDANAYMNIATELPPELNWDTIAPAAALVPHAPAAARVPALHVPLPVPAAPAPVPLPVPAHVPAAPAALARVPASQWQASQQPSYSNLKSGTRPTYRTWLRTTQKQKAVVKPAINILEDTPSVPSATFADALNDAPLALNDAHNALNDAPLALNDAHNALNDAPNAPAPALAPNAIPNALATTFAAPPAPVPPAKESTYTPSLKPKRKRITRTLKYKLGKHANGKVSVLIKNSQTRRKVQTEQALLKQKSILDIKNHLRSNNLLKVGSNAPNDVLRHLYEQSILAGQVENKAKDTLIHNYFNEEKK